MNRKIPGSHRANLGMFTVSVCALVTAMTSVWILQVNEQTAVRVGLAVVLFIIAWFHLSWLALAVMDWLGIDRIHWGLSEALWGPDCNGVLGARLMVKKHRGAPLASGQSRPQGVIDAFDRESPSVLRRIRFHHQTTWMHPVFRMMRMNAKLVGGVLFLIGFFVTTLE